MKKLYRSVDNRMISGVCGGIAEYFKVDVNIIRLAFLIAFVFSMGGMTLIYVAARFMIPSRLDVR